MKKNTTQKSSDNFLNNCPNIIGSRGDKNRRAKTQLLPLVLSTRSTYGHDCALRGIAPRDYTL
ncbi:hypothetical protein [uncultured Kiloniella sp.]|uniref:hypothetical protein n=1 Tax=uncultured Kiloniella sp. TaxID=1133091 RepID=UPI00261B12F2|nr:hypothetical protein [uncultured Kiloniella sp.]